MADNTQIYNPAAGDIIATDDIAGVKYQRSKITLGNDGVNDGDLSSSNPMPVVDATLVDGTAKVTNRGGAKGATAAADITSTSEGADHQALDVQIYHGGTAKDPTQIRPLTTADTVSLGGTLPPLSAGSLVIGKVGIDQSSPGTTNKVSLGSDQVHVIIDSPSGAATAALQTQPGVDIGDVTINNAAGAAAVNIQDGGNSITVDGTFWQATQPVSMAALPTDGASDSTIIHLRKIIKLLETLTVVDSAQRQRVALDAITATITVTNQTTLAGMDREMYINQARNAANSLRQQLVFS